VPHEPRQPPEGAMTAEQQCDECGKTTVWFLALASPVPGAFGQAPEWQCSGLTAEGLEKLGVVQE
jgi:hypothetical protein